MRRASLRRCTQGAGLLALSLSAFVAAAQGEDLSALRAAATASPRPELCRSPAGLSARWLALRDARQEQYCSALARGYTRLAANPRVAAEQVKLAESAFPQLTDPQRLKAQVHLATGNIEQADTLFTQLARQGVRLSAPALHDAARAAWLRGDTQRAQTLYGTLAPRAALLSARRRPAAIVETGLVAMTEGALSVATHHLSHARRFPMPPALAMVAQGALSLALSRAAQDVQAAGLVRQPEVAWALVDWLDRFEAGSDTDPTEDAPESTAPTGPVLVGQTSASVGVYVTLADLYAMAANAARQDRDLAADYWVRALELLPTTDRWRAHAVAALAAVRSQKHGR